MTQQQQRFLLNRLDDSRQTKPKYYEDVNVEVPVRVRTARFEAERAAKVINAWEKRMRTLRQKRSDRISKSFMDAKNLVLFGGDAKPALKAVEKFEKTQF